jgi:hypothetical protein
MRACIHMTLDDFMDSFSKDFYQFSGLLVGGNPRTSANQVED